MKTPAIVKLDTDKAIHLWNELAFSNPTKLTIALNPQLFRFFAENLKLNPFYFILYQDEKVVGLLPLVLCGNKIISIPHFSHGGLFRLNQELIGLSDEDLIRLLDNSICTSDMQAGFYEVNINQFSEDEKLQNHVIEIRQTQPLFGNQDSEKVLHTLALKKNQKEQFEAFNSNLRRKITKAKKNRIQVKIGNCELVEDFSFVYNKNMHQLGSPTLGKNFFKSLCETASTTTEIAVAYLNDQPIGGGFCIWYDGFFENTWFSTLKKYNQLYTSYALHSEMINSAIKKNCNTYSMGRSSKDSGVQQYKLQWPVEEKIIYFNTTAQNNISLKDQKWLTGIWKIMPKTVVNLIGPSIAKKIY